MDLLTLRESLETLLADDLGVYTLANGIETPAISVRAAGELTPAQTKVSGLECVIEKQPELSLIRQYAPGPAFRRYTLYLVSWDGKELGELAQKVVRGFEGAVTAEVRALRVPPGLGPQDQMRITLQFNPIAEEAAA